MVINITLHPLGYTTGMWCPHCHLPSAVEACYTLTTNHHPTGGVHSLTLCHDCGWRA